MYLFHLNKLFFFLLFLFLSVSVIGQERGITIRNKRITLQEAFTLIEEQTGYSIAYAHSRLNLGRTSDVSLTNAGIDKTLDILLKGTNHTYRIKGYHIIIIPSVEDVLHPDAGDSQPDSSRKQLSEEEGYLPDDSIYRRILKEVIITAPYMYQGTDRSSYFITEKMRAQASNTLELLDLIHGIHYDRLSGSIEVSAEKDVLFLVDGMAQSEAYIKNLSPDRILKVEVMTDPGGHYFSQGYNAIVHIILKKEYTGYDIYIRNSAVASLGGNNGNKWLANDQPAVGFTYTKNNLTIFANYMYTYARWNTPVFKWQNIPNMLTVASEETGKKDPNNRYRSQSGYAGGGINYQLTPRHSLSFQMDYRSEHDRTEDYYRYTNTLHPENSILHYTSLTTNQIEAGDYVATIFYKGSIGSRLKLYSDFSYNR